jgi:tRNA A-37 threonylcarbamoyl transferase component Bud32
MRKWLATLPNVPEGDSLSAERDQVRSVRPPVGCIPLSLKKYTPPPLWRSSLNELTGRGSRARRAFEHGQYLLQHGVPTPRPVAWLEVHRGCRILEQYLVTECIPESCSLRGALLHHYYEKPICREVMELLQLAADAVRKLHDAHLEHRDLRNQNILVARDEQGKWKSAYIVDLHRGKILKTMPLSTRGRDNGRITLPSDLRRIFFEMQTSPETVSASFKKAERRVRRRIYCHHRSHRLRHPFQKMIPPARDYPPEKEIWIWDDRSRQAIPALRSRDKRPHYRKRDLLEMASASLQHGRKIKSAFKEIQQEAWSKPVVMNGRIGLSCNLERDRFEKERRWLEPLGPLPLMVRLYHHENSAAQRFAQDAIRKLQAEGHRITVAMVQDRRAIQFPASWQAFVEQAGGALSGFVEGFEVGHAINRVKWGVWNYEEYRSLISPFKDWQHRFPQIPLMGPAGIDFEYPRVLPLLDQWPDASLTAFSHHLYVDRRGAPENQQAGYDTVAKLAMARAMARVHPACAERVVVSEVNWPLKGTGVWSPVGSPYQSPGARLNDPSVDEESYADFMRRYFLLALCSGMAEQVYWWNLAAHGFGLIDDRDPGGWRPRPAYHVFKELVEQMRDATFEREIQEDQRIGLTFSKAGATFEIGWAYP